MASINKQPNGRRTVQFYGADGKRRSLRLGKVPQRTAEEVKVKVEALNAAAISGLPIDGETAGWLVKIGDDLAEKLAAAGLVARRASMTLGGFLADYIARRGEDKPGTAKAIEKARRPLVEFLGEATPMRDVSPGDADEYLASLKQRFAPATASRSFRRARQFFRSAVRSRLLAANPFDGIATPAEVDISKQVFVSIADARKVIEECPTLDLRVIVALARFGGIRVPSELNIAWSDVLWDKDRIRITSPKTEHHEGKAERWIPIFPELRPYLEEAFEAAADGAVYVIANERYRDNPSLRSNLTRAIRRAGLTPWPKPFVNLRSSRETELAETFPLHVVVAWLGNTQAIAQKHYLQVTDDHFARGAMANESGAKSGAIAVRNAVPQAAAPSRTVSHGSPQPVAAHGKTPRTAPSGSGGHGPNKDPCGSGRFNRRRGSAGCCVRCAHARR